MVKGSERSGENPPCHNRSIILSKVVKYVTLQAGHYSIRDIRDLGAEVLASVSQQNLYSCTPRLHPRHLQQAFNVSYHSV